MFRNLALEMVRVTEAAALMTARLMGRGDADAAAAAAIEATHKAFDIWPICGTLAIGFGEQGTVPMLYTGEKLGTGWRQSEENAHRVDIAVAPLDGAELCATGAPDALTAIALAENGQFIHVPRIYMNKIAVGPEARGAINITESPTWNLHTIAEAKRCRVEDLTVVILNRDRHRQLIEEVRAAGARIRLINDGDVSAAIAASNREAGIDVLMGIGGAYEGVIAAAAICCVGGDMQSELLCRTEDERKKAEECGIRDCERIYYLEDLVRGNVMFAATGITDGIFLKGVHFFGGGATTHSVVMRSRSGTVRFIEAHHRFDQKPDYSWMNIESASANSR